MVGEHGGTSGFGAVAERSILIYREKKKGGGKEGGRESVHTARPEISKVTSSDTPPPTEAHLLQQRHTS